jgi:hypothetical protein
MSNDYAWLTWKLGLGIVWNYRGNHEDTDRTPVVEFAGHVVECFGDEHDRGEM